MAAYALGLMEQMFDQRWTTHLLFADQQQVVSLNWTYESARARVESILARVPAGVPTEYVPSEYCSWCARRDTCPVRLEQTQNSLALVQMAAKDSIPQILARFLADPELSGKFILGWRMVEKEIAERVELFLRDALVADPTACSCVRLVQQQGAEWFGPEAIEKAAPTLGVAGLVAALGGRVGGKKWREVCAAHGVPVDEADARAGATIKKLVAAKAAPPQKTPRLKKAPKQKAAANA